MRYLGLDLGTKSLGVAITDKTGTLVRPLTVIKFAFEDYESALKEVLKVINENSIDKVVLGLPKNMDGTLGFASDRSMKFLEMLKNNNVVVELQDERLSTKSAESIVHGNNENVKNTKSKIDAIAASIILEDYLKRCKNDFKE